MKLDKLSDLKAVIALCRKTGVKSIEVDGVKLELNESLPIKPSKIVPDETVQSDIPTEEDLLYWSTQDVPAKTDQ